jgi:FkbM family methyltransferase
MKIFAYARQVVLKTLVRWNPGDISITHHHTGDRFKIHSFRHRGYWFKRDQREKSTIEKFSKILKNGDVVIELGGHIGYLSVIFAKHVGTTGRVIVFEPGLDNLKYIRQNVSGYSQVEIVEIAASDQVGTATFYEESLTGQNNSLIQDYDVLKTNVNRSGVECKITSREVPTTTLDQLVVDRKLVPNLVKIDIEGAELLALKGAFEVLKNIRPILMVEITNRTSEVVELFRSHNYRLFPEISAELTRDDTIPERLWNTFAVPAEAEEQIQKFIKQQA